MADADGGCTLVISGTATADGRVSELPADAVTASATRLLTRFAENLGVAAERGAEPGAGTGSGAGAGAGSEAGQGSETGPETETETETEPESETGPAREPGAEHVSVFDTEVPPSSLADEEEGTDDEPRAPGEPDVPVVPDLPEPPAEAAHARRTMIGRSAEEVDHAPPRGRYAPSPRPRRARPAPPCAGPRRRRHWSWRPPSSWAAPCAGAAEPERNDDRAPAVPPPHRRALDRPSRVMA